GLAVLVGERDAEGGRAEPEAPEVAGRLGGDGGALEILHVVHEALDGRDLGFGLVHAVDRPAARGRADERDAGPFLAFENDATDGVALEGDDGLVTQRRRVLVQAAERPFPDGEDVRLAAALHVDLLRLLAPRLAADEKLLRRRAVLAGRDRDREPRCREPVLAEVGRGV